MFIERKIPAIGGKKLLVVIGNGFDLDMNLATSYADFMRSSIFQESLEKSYVESADYANLNLLVYMENRFENNNKNWIDIEKELQEYAEKVDLSRYKDKGDAIKYIERSFVSLRDSLTAYLSNIDYSIIDEDSSALRLLRAIKDDYFCELYTFNYTDISRLDSYIGDTSVIKVHYIHGTLEDNSIILGFSHTNLPYQDLDFMIKYQNDFYKSNDFRQTLDNAEEVLIFGHTLGSTDYPYFREFFQRETDINRRHQTPINVVTFNASSKRQINREINVMTSGKADRLDINFIQTHGVNTSKEIEDFFEALRKRVTPMRLPMP